MNQPMSRIILLADDHVIIRRGLKVILDQYFPKGLILETDTTSGILRLLKDHPITHLILDMQLADSNVLEVFPIIRGQFPDLPIMIYSMSPEDIYAPRMMSSGAQCFLSKQSDESEVIRAMDLFFRGQKYLSPHLRELYNERPTLGANPISMLSERELTVFNRLLKGEGVKDISEGMNLKITTIATYKARIFEKTGANNLMELRKIADVYQYVVQ